MHEENQKTLYLVDVSSLFFRAYYAISSHLTNSKGLPTNALYGLFTMSCKFIREKKAQHIVYCFDHEKPSFRATLYPAYKANRKDTPEDLKVQIPYIKRLVSAMGIPLVEKEGYEADDLIGSLSQISQPNPPSSPNQTSQPNQTGQPGPRTAPSPAFKPDKVVIVSGDKDFAQLVSSTVSLYDPTRDKSYDSEEVKKKWGVSPCQINDYLALVGDISDNIPGARGIGPKGACKLLQEYQNLENIYQNLPLIQQTTAEKLKQCKEQVFLSQKLARIVTDMDLTKEVPDFKLKTLEPETLKNLLEELNFKVPKGLRLKSSTPSDKAPISDKAPTASYQEQKNQDSSPKATEEDKDPAPHQGVSYPLNGMKRLSSNLKLHKMDWNEFQDFIQPYGKVWVFPHKQEYFFVFKNKVMAVNNLNKSHAGAFFSDQKIRWLGYDLKTVWKDFDCAYSLPVSSQPSPVSSQLLLESSRPLPHWCSLIAGYLTEGGPPGTFAELCLKHLKKPAEDSLEPGEIYSLHKNLQKALEKKLHEMNMTKLYEEVEQPLISVLYEMEKQGMVLKSEELNHQKQKLEQKIQALEKEIFSYTKHEFNISSPKQLADVLFKEMGLTPTKKTKTGYSTDVQALSKLKEKHPIIPLIIQQREWFKLKTTYLEALPPLIHRDTGRVHTCFLQALTATGRLSSRNPNLQNIPIKTETGRQIRKAFQAPAGKQIISADYSQIELRILAHITKDPALCSAFEKDMDIHKATASEIHSIPLEQVSPQLRYQAKAINFGLIYGQGPFALSESLNISLAEAKNIIKNYFEKFKKVKEYMESVVQQAQQQGYVETLFGRRRFIKGINSPHFATKRANERVAINAPIQGTASDLVKMAMIQLRNSLYSPLLLQIHDELIFECEEDLLEEESRHIKHIMENIVDWQVPLKVNIHSGKDWHTAHA